jgi:hypothetical protein
LIWHHAPSFSPGKIWTYVAERTEWFRYLRLGVCILDFTIFNILTEF